MLADVLASFTHFNACVSIDLGLPMQAIVYRKSAELFDFEPRFWSGIWLLRPAVSRRFNTLDSGHALAFWLTNCRACPAVTRQSTVEAERQRK